jgi:dihydroxyacetone kinase-like protein
MKNSAGKSVLLKMAAAVQSNKAYLSEVDGLIGDGDHGVNMNKGFTLFADRIADEDIGFLEGLDRLGNILFSEIGGSMGPIYGTVFSSMAEAGAGKDTVDASLLADMLEAGLGTLSGIVDAKVGDKTLVDTLTPASEALRGSEDKPFAEALADMKSAAERGRDSTKDLVAKFGRSSRLGERSRGVLDAGATSCCIILCAMADGIIEQLRSE